MTPIDGVCDKGKKNSMAFFLIPYMVKIKRILLKRLQGAIAPFNLKQGLAFCPK